VTTLHRLLGSRPDTRHFRHHAGNPLPVDVLVVDEASMVDLEMMAAVLAALPPGARLVLLGDKDQLASVEAGAVLGELCRRARSHYSADSGWPGVVATASVRAHRPAGRPIDQAVAMLRHSHRFRRQRHRPAGGGGQCRHVEACAGPSPRPRRPRPAGAGRRGEGRAAPPGGRRHTGGPRRKRPQGYRHYLDVVREPGRPPAAARPAIDAWAARCSPPTASSSCCAACAAAVGRGRAQPADRRLAEGGGLIPAAEGWYAGRPVLVTRNDYGLGLMNGDIGITLELPGGVLRVAFPAGDGSAGIKWVQPSRLQAVETVFALTVHKSQGSEFTHVAMALPESLNPILTRELVYTGITRAKQWFTLADAPASTVLARAVERRVLRVSGLMAG
jgi:exodeoxyribonuclease V alpha subunit